MTAGTITPYRPGHHAGRDGFAQLLRAEWTKFRTVRGWVIGMIVAVLVTAGLGLFAAGGHQQLLPEYEWFERRPDPERPGVHDHTPGGTGRRGGERQLLLRAPAAGRERQHHRPDHLADRPDPESDGSGPTAERHASRPRAVGQGRDNHQGEHSAGIGVRGDDGHRGPRGTHAGRLHQRHGGPAGRRLPGVPALAPADPLRRHDHRLRLGRRHALDPGRYRPPGRAAVDRPGRAVRRVPGVPGDLRELRRRRKRDRRPQPGHRRLRSPQPVGRLAGRRVDRRLHRTPPTGQGSAGITRPAAGSP